MGQATSRLPRRRALGAAADLVQPCSAAARYELFLRLGLRHASQSAAGGQAAGAASGSRGAAEESQKGSRTSVPSLHGPLPPPGTWWENLQRLEDFVAAHGWIPRSLPSGSRPFQEGEKSLGRWCNHQRQRYKGNKSLGPQHSAEQEAALEAIPGWKWDVFAEGWRGTYEEVAAFQQQHRRLPHSKVVEEESVSVREKQLWKWCSNQRQRHKGRGMRRPLSPEQAALLEALPGWKWDPYKGWQERYGQVLAFVREHGQLPRMQSTKRKPFLDGEKALGVWCRIQRQRQRGQGARSSQSPEQMTKLEAIPGWWWKHRASRQWEQ